MTRTVGERRTSRPESSSSARVTLVSPRPKGTASAPMRGEEVGGSDTNRDVDSRRIQGTPHTVVTPHATRGRLEPVETVRRWTCGLLHPARAHGSSHRSDRLRDVPRASGARPGGQGAEPGQDPDPVGVPPRHRRDPRRRRDHGDGVPRPRAGLRGCLHRSRPVLRGVGLRHHRAADVRVPAHRHHQVGRLLRTARASADPGQGDDADRRPDPELPRGDPHRVAAADGQVRGSRGRLRLQLLLLAARRCRLLRPRARHRCPAAHVVAVGRGAVLPRSPVGDPPGLRLRPRPADAHGRQPPAHLPRPRRRVVVAGHHLGQQQPRRRLLPAGHPRVRVPAGSGAGAGRPQGPTGRGPARGDGSRRCGDHRVRAVEADAGRRLPELLGALPVRRCDPPGVGRRRGARRR